MARHRLAVLLWLGCLSLWSRGLWAQDLDHVQIHGFATQSFLFSSNNNYLTMKSSSGSLQWTEGAVNLNDSVSDKMRVGIQLHMYQMGQIGGPNVLVDWVSADYKVNDNLGFRAGKIKIPMGLFNDSQDVDSLFLWTMLPQANYPDDNRDFDLAALGGEVYGSLALERYGRVQYRGFAGESRLDDNGGYMLGLADYGFTFPTPPSGKVFGGDLRWVGAWQGLTLGVSSQSQALDGSGPQGTVHLAPFLLTAYYAEWSRGKWYVAGEYWRVPPLAQLQFGTGALWVPQDQRSWYPMVSYQVTKSLQVGTYYSHAVNKAGDVSQPENHSKDWVISGRYNLNANLYGKIEAHFLHGTEIGYHSGTNPDGLKPNTAMLAARIGFTF
jgi:hypothetical protein